MKTYNHNYIVDTFVKDEVELRLSQYFYSLDEAVCAYNKIKQSMITDLTTGKILKAK